MSVERTTVCLGNFTSDPNGQRSCRCRDPCLVSEYEAKISTTKFPSVNYAFIERMNAGKVLVKVIFGVCFAVKNLVEK